MSPLPSLSAETFAAHLCKMQDKRVLLIGDIMLDSFIDGVVTRISPEAPVPVLRRNNTFQMPGGAANVAHNLAHIGLSVSLIGVVGADPAGVQLQNKLADIPKLTADILTVDGRTTTQKTRFRAQNQQILRVDDEETLPLSTADTQQLIALIDAQIATQPDIIVLSDYAKGCLNDTIITHIMKQAKTADIPVITDPKSNDFTRYAGSALITPNLAEISAANGAPLADNEEITRFARAQMDRCTLDAMLVTLGARGMLLVREQTVHHLPASAREVYDVSGAGDTVIALIAAGLSIGSDLLGAVEMANHGAGIVVGKSGTATLTVGELLSGDVLGDTTDIKQVYAIDALPALVSERQSWAQAGQKVAFTNGCFDLLHPGHIDSLKQTANGYDRLIVGINTDRSVKALKGEARPIQAQMVRATILASLPFVDAVILFDEDTPAALIDALVPDRLTKGGDYRADDVVGYDTVTKNGGRVDIIPLLAGYSTSGFLDLS